MIKDTTNDFTSLVREIKANIEVRRGETLVYTLTPADYLISFKVERSGENGKFFGFGYCQKLEVKLLDSKRELSFLQGDKITVSMRAGGSAVTPFPHFYIQEITRDENNNDITLTAEDILYKARENSIAKLNLSTIVTVDVSYYAMACASFLGLMLDNFASDEWNLAFDEQANFYGNEQIRTVLNAIAEATQSIYYVSADNKLTFKRLDKNGAAALQIGKDDYFTLKSGGSYTLNQIINATELGDNVGAEPIGEGVPQVIRDNQFWENPDLFLDKSITIGSLVDNATAAVAGTTITTFNLSWRGNFLTEIGDKISIIGKDDELITSYILNDSITYNGGLSQTTSWEYKEQEPAESNPSNIGEAINQTIARVDKVNKEITLLSETQETTNETIKEMSAEILTNPDSIKFKVETSINDITALGRTVDDISNNKLTEINQTADAISARVQTIEEDGAGKVQVEGKNYTFDINGLNISADNAETTTTITENGMTVQGAGNDMLTANIDGVEARNLKATTYLIIGGRSRFENYDKDGNQYTGCFWIGG